MSKSAANPRRSPRKTATARIQPPRGSRPTRSARSPTSRTVTSGPQVGAEKIIDSQGPAVGLDVVLPQLPGAHTPLNRPDQAIDPQVAMEQIQGALAPLPVPSQTNDSHGTTATAASQGAVGEVDTVRPQLQGARAPLTLNIQNPDSQVAATVPVSMPNPYYPVPGSAMSQPGVQLPVQIGGTHAPHFTNGALFPQYAYPQQSVDGQGGQFHYPNQWPYMNPYFYSPRAGLPRSPAHSTVASPTRTTTSHPATPKRLEAAFGIDPARLAAPAFYPASIAVASQTSNPSTTAPAIEAAPNVPAASNVDSVSPTVSNATDQNAILPTNANYLHDPSEDGESVSRKRLRDDESSDEDDDSDGSGDGSGSKPRSKGNKRLIASKSRPLWEHVIGAGTGAMTTAEEQDEHDKVIRTRRLPHPYILQAAATRHYRRTVPDILTRVESLASRTGCYAYIALQHPESGSNFYYYASKKMRDEAPTDIKEIHRKVGDTMSKLLKAHKSMKVTLQAEVQNAELRAASAEVKAAEAERKARALEGELALLKAASAEF